MIHVTTGGQLITLLHYKVRILLFIILLLSAKPLTNPSNPPPLLRKCRRVRISLSGHLNGASSYPQWHVRLRNVLVRAATSLLCLQSLPKPPNVSLITLFLLCATYIPVRLLSPHQTLPLLIGATMFGIIHPTILNPTTLTGGILTLLHTYPALQQYIDSIPIALNICTEDPILTIAITVPLNGSC